MELKKDYTSQGFRHIEFADMHGDKCSIQKSSHATENAIWFGIDDADPKILDYKMQGGIAGWVPFEIPDNVLLTTRMHLTQEQVKELLPILTIFAETGELHRSTTMLTIPVKHVESIADDLAELYHQEKMLVAFAKRSAVLYEEFDEYTADEIMKRVNRKLLLKYNKMI